MAKKVIKDRFIHKRKVLEVEQTESNTTVRDGRGNVLFRLNENLGGAWSERRVVSAMLRAYTQGLKSK